MKKLQLGIIALMIIMLIIILAGCSQVISPAKRYQSKFAEPVEHSAWSKRHSPIFGHKNASLKRAEDYLSQSKKAAKKREKSKRLEEKIASINAKADMLKSKNND